MAEETKEITTKNTVTIETSGPCRKKVCIEIPRETITKIMDEQYQTFRKEAIVPGFRKGHAPRELLEKRFGKDINEQVKLKLLAEASEAAIKDNNIDYLREPDIKYDDINLPADGPLKFDFEVEVRPEFDLPKLEGIPIEKTKTEITDGLIDREVEMLQKYAGVWTPKDTGAKVDAEDQVVADVMLDIEGQEQKLDNASIQVRPNGFIGEIPVEQLDTTLIGAKTGEEKQIEVDVPKTYYREDLRGKKVKIRLNIKDIKWLKPAELNQDFFTRCGFANEQELRQAIRERLQNRMENQAKAEMAEQIYKYLLDNTKIELPDQIAADQAAAVLRRQYINLLMQGLQREQIDEHIEQLKASSEEQAKRQLKVFFIMDKIAQNFKIEVTDEEVNGHIAMLAKDKKIRPERLKEEMQRDGSLTEFKLQVRDQKVISKLLESAVVTEVEPKHHKSVVHKHSETKAKEHKPEKELKSHTTTAAKEHKSAKKPAVKEDKEEKADKKKPTRKKKTEKG